MNQVEQLRKRIASRGIADVDRIRCDEALDGCRSVAIDVDGDRWNRVRAVWRRGKFRIVASDGVVQSDTLLATPDVVEACAFLAGWIAAMEE